MKLLIRKVQYAPESEGDAPSVETTKDFLMSDKQLHVKASLDKEVLLYVNLLSICGFSLFKSWFWCRPQVYYHGEAIRVHVSVNNNSSKNIKNIIISGDVTVVSSADV